MQVTYPRCAGLDVHQKTVVACRICTLADGRTQMQTRTFQTTTNGLLQLRDWLQEQGCTHVAMESTGEYWKPVYNVLEGGFELLLVNARHIKAVPGRKTDVKDAEWIADLLRHGLLRPSFVPPLPQRDLRDLTRQRANLVGERADVINRLQKVLEGANIKLASVVTDVTGVSARAMLSAMLSGQTDPQSLVELAYGRMRQKRAALEQALTGFVREHHRFLLRTHLTHMDFLEEQIEQFNQQIAQQIQQMSSSSGPPPAEPTTDPLPSEGVAKLPEVAASEGDSALAPASYTRALQLLNPVPGLGERVLQAILAEIGTDMRRFPSEAHLSSWAGVSPGNNESAGKRYSGKTTGGNMALRVALTQAAYGAVR